MFLIGKCKKNKSIEMSPMIENRSYPLRHSHWKKKKLMETQMKWNTTNAFYQRHVKKPHPTHFIKGMTDTLDC